MDQHAETTRSSGNTAFKLMLIAALTVATLNPSLRPSMQVTPQTTTLVSNPGAPTSLGMDLLCALPALLVLLRRTLGRKYVLRWSWSMLPLAGLCLWMLLSTAWASDKFAALVGACHWTAAMSLAWAASQVVRDWGRLRMVAAACVGLLGLYVVQAAHYRFTDVPALQQQWKDHPLETLAQNGFAPDSFRARQLGNKIMAGELMGFTNSPDAFGEIVALLCAIAAGVLIQCRSEGNTPAAVTAALLLGLGLALTAMTYSKTAMATPFLAAAVFLLIWRKRAWLGQHSARAFWIGGGLLAVLLAGIIRHGLTHGNLPGKSLTFRWYYWVGAAKALCSSRRMFCLGTGWNNFGLYYLQFRPLQSPDEVKDPHCFVARFFVELGLVGGLLMAAWLGRLWWELTQKIPAPPEVAPKSQPPVLPALSALRLMAAVVGFMLVLSLCLCVDWWQNPEYLVLEVALRLSFGAVLLIAAVLAAARSLRDGMVDERPAPWILWGMLVGMGMFLVDNLVDYSLFESSALMVFALVAGSALGMRQTPGGRRRQGAFFALICSVAVWMAVCLGLWMPTISAEQNAAEADQLLRDNHFGRAMNSYVDAAADQPLNADYLYRAFRAAVFDRLPAERQLELISQAIAFNPRQELYYLNRARCQVSGPSPDVQQVGDDFRAALALDPNNMEVRVEFARILSGWGGKENHAEARRQYQQALKVNDALPADEVQRLDAKTVAEARKCIQAP